MTIKKNNKGYLLENKRLPPPDRNSTSRPKLGSKEKTDRTYTPEETALSPITEAIRVTMKNSLQKVTGSLKKKMPRSTVPTAPIPVQTG